MRTGSSRLAVHPNLHGTARGRKAAVYLAKKGEETGGLFNTQIAETLDHLSRVALSVALNHGRKLTATEFGEAVTAFLTALDNLRGQAERPGSR